MREGPPAELVELLERLRLASAADVRGVYDRVRRLAGDLPLFQTVWVDALAQARKITPYQAAEIHGGRGAELAVGPFVICRRQQSLGYATANLAQDMATGERVQLLTARAAPSVAARASEQFPQLVSRLAALREPGVLPAKAAGRDGEQLWIAFAPPHGESAAAWVLHHGRLPWQAALEIARQMAAALAELETAGIVHGDVSASALWIGGDGSIELSRAGVRALVRPEEGFPYANLPPECYDFLAPERVSTGGSPTIASDLFACGCLWWHLLTGRPPMPGGDALGKLRAIQGRRISDVRQLAPDVPASFAEAIQRCTQRDPHGRPASFVGLAELLGPPTRDGRNALRRALRERGHAQVGLRQVAGAVARSKEAKAWLAAIAGCLAIVALVSWPLWHAAKNGTTAGPRRATSLEVVSRPATPPAHKDSHVRLAGHTDIADDSAITASYEEHKPDVLLLRDRQPFSPERLHNGQTARPANSGRYTIAAPPSGLRIAADGARFENIDFIWNPRPEEITDPDALAILRVESSHIAFVNCTFQAATIDGFRQPAAIWWSGPRRGGALSPAGKLSLKQCVLKQVAVGVVAQLQAPLGLQCTDTLMLGPGPLLHFPHPPADDEPVDISLQHVTLRDAASCIAIDAERFSREPASINITADACVFMPRHGSPLVAIRSPSDPSAWSKGIQWAGQGSLLSPDAPLAVWAHGAPHLTRDEIELNAEGLVAGKVTFADASDRGAAASRLTGWQAPLQSDDPPGIDEKLPGEISR